MSEKVLTADDIRAIVSRADEYVLSEELVAGSYAEDVEALVKSQEALRALATELAKALDAVRTTTFVWSLSKYVWNDLYSALAKARAAGVLQ